MRRLALALALAVATGLFSPATAYLSERWFQGATGWEDAFRQHRKLGAPLFVYFRTDWCPHCRTFDELLAEPEVRRGLQGVMKVTMNPENSREEQRLFRESYGLDAFPALIMHPADGSPPRRLSHRGPAERFLSQFEGAAPPRAEPPPIT